MKFSQNHSFHIPVMGTGFTIDTPFKVAKYGISSVISLVDDVLIEKIRKHYCTVYKQDYEPIPTDIDECRAKRITAYLNFVNTIVNRQSLKLRTQPFEEGTELVKYFEMLPHNSPLKQQYLAMLDTEDFEQKSILQKELRKMAVPGSIDVNIMTKLDCDSYRHGVKMGQEYSDALSALRGVAQSDSPVGMVFSAGLNRRLYSYAENFDCFYHNTDGYVEKRIILKVSDYRSAIVQGKFLAKKGIWVSEYRIESGLNCGGHAFATKGCLIGPVLQEFKDKRAEFIDAVHDIYTKATIAKKRPVFKSPLPIQITAQGGIGTAVEHEFLIDYYELNSIGWASPFLLVPEVTSVDADSLEKLIAAGPDDIYMSDVSPMNIIFQNLRTSASEQAKHKRIKLGRPGTSCSNGYLKFNTEFTERPICVASAHYQKIKIEQIIKSEKFTPEQRDKEIQKVSEKTCICHDLGASALIKHKIEVPGDTVSPSICPGPNLAYFKKIHTLSEKVSHIYGKINVLCDNDRPHMFINELKIYVEFLMKRILVSLPSPKENEKKYFQEFTENLRIGIEYYKNLIEELSRETEKCRKKMMNDLMDINERLERIVSEYNTNFVFV